MSTYIIIGVVVLTLAVWFVRHQRKLKLRVHLMQEAIRNRDFTFRLPTDGLLPGERAMQETLNQLGATIRQQVNRSEVDAWERLTRVLTHEIMNATAPITSISHSLLCRLTAPENSVIVPKSSPQSEASEPTNPQSNLPTITDGVQAIYDASRHLSDFVANYRKMTELEKPVITEVNLRPLLDEIAKAYPTLTWEVTIPSGTTVHADVGMFRQVLVNLVTNAVEAGAKRMVVELSGNELYIGNDGLPIPAEIRQSLFVPFFTTKRRGSGIGLPLSRRMMMQQGGTLDLAETPRHSCHTAFILTI